MDIVYNYVRASSLSSVCAAEEALMSRVACVCLALLVSFSATGADRTYSFRVTIRNGVLRLTDAVGTHWRWLTYSCPTAQPDCEVQINTRGARGAANREALQDTVAGDPVDLGLVIVSASVLRARCLQPSCKIHYKKNSKTSVRTTLRYHQSVDIPVNAVVTLSLVGQKRKTPA